MTTEDKELESLITTSNSFEKQALDLTDEVESLKAQVYSLRKCLTSESQGGIIKNMGFMGGRIEWYDKVKTVIDGTPEQCLNSVKADAIEEMFNNMPGSGFNKLRDQGNWMTDYVDKLRANN